MRRKIMKRLTLTFSTAALVLTLCACGDNAKSPAHTQTDASLIQMEASASDAAEAVIDMENGEDENETTELMADDNETTEVTAVEETDIQSGNGKKADSDSKKDNTSKKDNATGNNNTQTGSSKKDSASGNSNSSVNNNTQTANGNTSKPGNSASSGSQTQGNSGNANSGTSSGNSGNSGSASNNGSSSNGSASKPPATTESKPSSTTEDKPQTTECSHVWENIVEHQSAKTHTEYYETNEIVGYHEFCNGCGMDLTLTYGGSNCNDARNHLTSEHASYSSKPIYETVKVPVEVEDEPAKDVVVGKRCKKCKMTQYN